MNLQVGLSDFGFRALVLCSGPEAMLCRKFGPRLVVCRTPLLECLQYLEAHTLPLFWGIPSFMVRIGICYREYEVP